MSETQPVNTPQPVATVDTTDPLTGSASVSSQTGNQNITGATKISSLEELRKMAPEVYQMMMESLAMNICNRMKHAQDHLKEVMRRYRQG